LNRIHRSHPAVLLFEGYIAAIGLGTALLILPWATVGGSLSLMDAVFTATSAICVTGLIVVDTGSRFTPFGQGVILCMIQIGGLGIMTVSVVLFRLVRRRIGFRQRMAVQELFSHTPRTDIYQLLRSIVVFTIIAEGIGTLLFLAHWWQEMPFPRALAMAGFHAVSAFCNAGFSLLSTGFTAYRDSLLLNVTACALIILGGLGFPVVYELWAMARKRRGDRTRLSIQTKAVLLTSGVLVLGGMLVFLAASGMAMGRDGTTGRVLASLFQSVTCRTAGFNTVEIGALQPTDLAFMIFLMFFGASPGSCGGGVKTTTLAVLAAFSLSRLRGRVRVNMFNKSVPHETVTKCVIVTLLSVALISVALILLLWVQQGRPAYGEARAESFLAYLFEVVSAFGTVGLSMGATDRLGIPGKIIIVLMMLIGRVGVPTFTYIIAGAEARGGFEYAEENMMVG
jgi:trk system potassium uptake protein TrkH